MMGALQGRKLSAKGGEIRERGGRMRTRRSGGGRGFDSWKSSVKGRRFGKIEGEEGEVNAGLEVIVCRGDEGLELRGTRNKRGGCGRGGLMTKCMGINDASNAGDERVKRSGMLLNGWGVVMGVKEGLNKGLSRGELVGGEEGGIRDEPGERFLGGGGGVSFGSVFEGYASEFAIVRESW